MSVFVADKRGKTMRNLYLVQAFNTYVGRGFKTAYLPYAVGLLAAYAFEDEKIREEYCFKRFIFTREKTDEAVASFENPAVIGFSNYIWNTQYNLVLAEKVKKAYPECIIIFGGHNVPPDNSFLEKYPFIDYLIHGEGEEAFKALLLEFCKEEKDFSKISNISYRVNENEFVKNETEILCRLDYPSPYLNGWFDSIFEENPDMQLDAILETSRGCPRSCAYCDWGCNSSKIRFFPTERVLAEIDWLSDHGVKFIWGADSNFGAAERDMEIIDYLIDKREKTGCPERLRINYAMDKPQRVFEISCKLEQYDMSKEGATLSFQSLDPTVLANIGRRNMSMEKFSELLKLYTEAGITTYSELIAGLPGETYESFCRGFGKLLEAGQHRLITVYNCELLPNSPMAQPEFMKKHGIRVAESESLVAHRTVEEEVMEKTVFVVGTNTLSTEDWIACNVFACVEESLHHHGILKYIAIYLHYEKGYRYEDIYNALIDYTKNNRDSVLYPAYDFLYTFYKSISEGKPVDFYTNPVFGDETWINKKVAHLMTIIRIDEFYTEIKNSLHKLGIEEEIIDEIIRYQKTVLKLPMRNNFSADFEYDWDKYFRETLSGNHQPLEKRRIRISVNNEKQVTNWKEYALEAVWFGVNGIAINPNMTTEYI